MGHTINTNRKESMGGDDRPGRLPLSAEAKGYISRLRGAPKERTAFSLCVTAEGTRSRLWVINRGRGADSVYYAHFAPSGALPAWLPPASTYVARGDADLCAILRMFAEQPELFSKSGSDVLDEAPTEPYDDDSWEEA